MAGMNTDNAAVGAGFTRAVMIDGDFGGFCGLVKPDTDYDSRFKAFDTDNQEWIMVNGWMCSIEDMED